VADARAQQLLHQVIADPDSDLPRQVYADQLMQAGDPRGELIQVELALAGPLAIRKRELLKLRHAELLEANRRAWFPYKVRSYRTRGGFIHAVRATLAQLRAANALFANEPVVEVEVQDLDEASAGGLVTATWLPRIRNLSLRGRVGDVAFAALWKAAGAATLRSLNVTANGLGPWALADLDNGLPRLETLVVTANPIGNAGLEGLRAWPHLDQLKTLYVSKCRISAAGVGALLAGELPQLDKLCLSHNPLGDQVGAELAGRAAGLPALRKLELIDTGITAGAVKAVMAALPRLAALDARDNKIAAGDVAELASRVRV